MVEKVTLKIFRSKGFIFVLVRKDNFNIHFLQQASIWLKEKNVVLYYPQSNDPEKCLTFEELKGKCACPCLADYSTFVWELFEN